MMASRGAVVFGGAGFIGGHLLHRLRQAGVAPLYSVDLAAPRVVLPEVCYLYHDAEDLTGLVLDSPVDLAFDLVTPLALVPDPSGPDPYGRNPSRPLLRGSVWRATDTAGAISAFLRRQRIRRLVHVSSPAVYGHGDGAASEESPADPCLPLGWAQWRAEGIYRSWQAEQGAGHRLVICRAAAVFGAGGAGPVGRMAQAMARGLMLYPGRRDLLCPCYYIEDLIDALFYALAQDEAAVVFNACYPERLSLGDIAGALKSLAFPAARDVVLPWALVLLGAWRRGAQGFAAQQAPKDVVPGWLLARGQARAGGLAAGLQAWIGSDPLRFPPAGASAPRARAVALTRRWFPPSDR